MYNEGTIIALSSPPGSGAISIIRLSGKDAIDITDKVFKSNSNKPLSQLEGQSLTYGVISDGKEVIDEVVVSIYRAPHSYTGENIVEISCHGSPYIQQNIISTFLDKKVRLASPGEFTLRAYLNNKKDLSQAEAVSDLIASESKEAHRVAMDQMRGGYSSEIELLREKLIDFKSLIELELDFSEEDVEFANRGDLNKLLDELDTKLSKLIDSFSYGNVIKEGVTVTIAGKPNSGKSSLLNAILNDDKAIVSEIPGTTRDAIEDICVINGIKFRFIDTAGIRETKDKVESMGVDIDYESEVTDIQFNGTNSTTIVKDKRGVKKKIEAKFIIDASGYGRVIPKLLDLNYPSTLPNRSTIFTHFKDLKRPNTEDSNRIIAISHKPDVWIWVIPFANGNTSCGFVGNPDYLEKYKGTPTEKFKLLLIVWFLCLFNSVGPQINFIGVKDIFCDDISIL